MDILKQQERSAMGIKEEKMKEHSHTIQKHTKRARQPVSNQGIDPSDDEKFLAQDASEQTIPQRFEHQVAKYATRLAIKSHTQTLTYEALNRVANQVAHTILAQCGPGQEPVALLLDHGVPAIVGIMGVLKAGKIYVPLDPASSLERIASILADAQTSVIVTNDKSMSVLQEANLGALSILNIDRLTDEVAAENPKLPLAPDTPAIIFYTSGSTGHPKGVVCTHRNVLHCLAPKTLGYWIYPEDRVAYISSYSFSWSIGDIFGPLLHGAAAFPFDLRKQGVAPLAQWLKHEEITIVALVATVFRQFTDILSEDHKFPQLRQLMLGGETIYRQDVELFKKYFDQNCFLRLALGLTEACSAISYILLDNATEIHGDVMPVGYPANGFDVLLWDENGQEVGYHQIGEIVIRSRYLALGYWRDPELTRQKFLPDPDGKNNRIYRTGDLGRRRPDGCLEHLGRKDFQVKIRGARVELAEIETALHGLTCIKEAVVVARETPTGENYLAAYVVPACHPAPTVSDLRRRLADTLPDYMLPSAFVMMDTLPLTSTGKVDRQALPEPDQRRPELATILVTPRDELEHQLVQIFEDILQVHPIGVQDNFFDLGGNSLSYFRLFREIERQFEQTLPMEEVAQDPTIEHLADMLRQPERLSHQISTPPSPISHNPFTLIREVFKTPRSSWAEKFRHARHILLHQLRHIGPDFDDFIVPYAVGARFLAWFCSQRWVHTMFFQHQKQLIQQCLTCIDGSPHATDVIRHSLLCNFWSQWRIAALEANSSEQFARWVTVTGLPTVQEFYEKGHGVILVVSHFALCPVIKSVLNRKGLGNSFIGGWQGAREHPYPLELLGLSRLRQDTRLYRNPSAWVNSQLYLGAQILQHGKIVMVAGDGYQGQRGLTIPFHGRLRCFRSGFAELAISTRINVIPVWVSMEDNTGQVQIIFLEPLDTGSADMPHQDRVECLLRQYIQVLEDIWATDLGSIGWDHLERFLALPPVPPTEPPQRS